MTDAPPTVDYFAYGANLDVAVLQRRRFELLDRRAAVLPNFELRFNKRASRSGLPEGVGFANVVERTGASVEGVLYTVTQENLQRLDHCERAPEHYRRNQMIVETALGPRRCEVYRAHPNRVADNLVPIRNYVNHILSAKDVLSAEYWSFISSQECYRAACSFCQEFAEMLFVEADGSSRAHCSSCGQSSA